MKREPSKEGNVRVERTVGRCWIFHNWGQWADIARGEECLEGRVIGFYVRQERRCKRCGRIQIRIESA